MPSSTSSNDKYFKSRNNNRVTEPKAIEYLTKRKIRYVRFGLDALDSNAPIWKIPVLIRSVPDYIVFSKYDKPYFFEAKGFKNTIKLKIRDLDNYKVWNVHLAIMLFLYDVSKDSYVGVMLNKIVKLIQERKPTIKAYPEHKENTYYEIPVSWLPDFKKMEDINENK